jgi:large subunit ribosomal protein L5
MKTTKEKVNDAFGALKSEMGYKNVMQAPRIVKAVVSIGTGKVQDKAKLAVIQDRLARITGQKTSPRPAKQSIASFKLREGDIIGYQVTMRGPRMFSFLDKLIHVALPQTKDFRGLKTTAIDEMGNITIGIKEHTIFPETGDEDVKDIFSFAITIVTTAKTKKEAEALLRHIGLPLKAEGAVEVQRGPKVVKAGRGRKK